MLNYKSVANAYLNYLVSIVELLGCVSCCHSNANQSTIVDVLHCLGVWDDCYVWLAAGLLLHNNSCLSCLVC